MTTLEQLAAAIEAGTIDVLTPHCDLDTSNVRLVTVAQLERWATCLRNSGYSLPAQDILSILGKKHD